MTSDQMDRAIEFLLEHHAKFSADIGELREAISNLKDVQQHQSDNIANLTADVHALTGNTTALQSQIDSIVTEMRDGFEQLILGNEVTRDLASKVASLEIQTSQRVTDLDRRVSDLESKA